MNLAALKAVLEHLSGKCQDDMADKFDRPEEKMESAMKDALGKGGDDMAEEDEEDIPSVVAPEAMAKEEEDENENPEHRALREFMKPKKPMPAKPGTAVMIALESKKPVGGALKKSLKGMMHG